MSEFEICQPREVILKFLVSAISVIFIWMLLVASPASAQASHTWVASFGSDANPCTRASPCATFFNTLPKTAANGEITCVDSNDYGVLEITRSITINCHDANGFVSSNSSFGILISADSFALSDNEPTVRLRNLTLNGLGTAGAGIQITGTGGLGGAPPVTVIIEDCLIDGRLSQNGRGIDDQRRNNGKLIVTNTTIQNIAGGGISVLPNGTATGNVQVLLNNVRSYHNGTGAQFGNLTRVTIDRSAFTGNTGAGILTVAGAIVTVDRSTITHNANGVQAAGGVIALANSNIQLNTSQGVNVSGGTVFSFGNNRIAFNASPGTAPSPAGAASTDLGQQ